MFLDARVIRRSVNSPSYNARWIMTLDGRPSCEDTLSGGCVEFPGRDPTSLAPLEFISSDQCYDHGLSTVIKMVELIEDTETPYVVERCYLASSDMAYAKLFRVVHKTTFRRVRKFFVRPYLNNAPRVIDPAGLVIMSVLRRCNPEKRCERFEAIADAYVDVMECCRVSEYSHGIRMWAFDINALTETLSTFMHDYTDTLDIRESDFDRIVDMIKGTPNHMIIPPCDVYTLQHSTQTQVAVPELMGMYYRKRIDTSPTASLADGRPMYPNMGYWSEFLDAITTINLTDFCVHLRDGKMEVEYAVNRYASFQNLNHICPENEIDMRIFGLAESGFYTAYGGNGHRLDMRITLSYEDEVEIVFFEGDDEPRVVYFDLHRCALLAPTFVRNTLPIMEGGRTHDEEYREATRWI